MVVWLPASGQLRTPQPRQVQVVVVALVALEGGRNEDDRGAKEEISHTAGARISRGAHVTGEGGGPRGPGGSGWPRTGVEPSREKQSS